ncbi:DNA-processing protein DprA [candidate division KSB1 bacterium]|nr:DNA-processing protein DprA [candidate division KSB1 bacterium]
MNESSEYPYWMALSHLPNWGNEKINRLIIEIIQGKKISFSEFFALNEKEMKIEFNLSSNQLIDINEVRSELPNYSFLAENFLAQDFQLIPLNSKDYSETLKQNLKTKDAPPLLYVKGNIKLLNEDSIAIVGSRSAADISLAFTKNIAKKCAERYEVVVSGFAKGVDKMALDATLEYNGHSIIVLPQGILTFGSGIKKYYKKIIDGDVLILSTYHPKAPWSIGLAMNRNIYIYGLAKTIYVAESDSKGGTWNGVIDGLKKGRKIFIRKPEKDEKNANNMLIMQGAIPVDPYGQPVEADKDDLEGKLKRILSKGQLSIASISEKLDIEIDQDNLKKLLANLPFVDSKLVKKRKYYFLKNSIPHQPELFSDQTDD